MVISPETTPNGVRSSNDMVLCRGSFTDFEQTTPKQRSPCETRKSIVRQSSTASMMLIQEIKKLEQLQDELGEDANRALQALQKEVECLRLAQADMNQDAAATIEKLQEEIQALKETRETEGDRVVLRGSLGCSMRGEINRLQAMGNNAKLCMSDVTIATLEEKLQNVQKSIDNMVLSSKAGIDERPIFDSINSDYGRKPSPRSIRRTLEFDNDKNRSPNVDESLYTPTSYNNQSITKRQGREMMGDISSKEINIPTNQNHRRNNSVDIKKMQNMFKTAAEENIRSIRTYVMELKERVAKLQYQKQLLVCQVRYPNGLCMHADVVLRFSYIFLTLVVFHNHVFQLGPHVFLAEMRFCPWISGT
jgi:centromeric protein E